MVTVNVGGKTNIPVTLMHVRESEVNLVSMGLTLRKYIKLREIAQRGRSLLSMIALFVFGF